MGREEGKTVSELELDIIVLILFQSKLGDPLRKKKEIASGWWDKG